jgi:hypothetical protein
MNREKLLLQLPTMIEHPKKGFAVIEIIVDKPKNKGACYRHEDKLTSFGAYGNTWEQVYETIKNQLIKEALL